MKQERKLKYREKLILRSWGLNPENWYHEREADGYITVINKLTGDTRSVPNYRKGEKNEY